MQIQGKYRCINCFNELNTENEICSSCGYDIAQYKTAMHRLSPGTVLDNRYYIGRVIGEGGFGITYVGYDANLEMRVAIKEFFLSGVNTRNTTYSDEIESSAEEKEVLFETYREKFINEARVLAKFNNEDGIVTVYNFFKANNTAYIIMEFLDGQNLKEYLKSKGKLSTDEVIEIFIPIMRTLDKVHTAKLIHRDISPDNIIFTKNDKVKLLDFGAAREVSDDNKSLSVVLKHGYAPPEQYQTRGKQGPWTDVYALSATIYKCLTGKTPIEAMDRTLGEDLEPVCVITADCPKKISDVIMKGLEIKIANRYQSMGEMADDLKKAHTGIGNEREALVREDAEATVLIFDKNKSDVSDNRVHNHKENKKQGEALDKEKSSTRDTKNDATVIDIIESTSSHKAKNSNKKPLIWALAAIALCVIVGLSAMMYAKSGREQGENADSQVAEGTIEEVPQVSADGIELDETYENMENAEAEDTVEEKSYAYLKSANVGDVVEFGNYNGYTKWRVLQKNSDKLLLITEESVKDKKFNSEYIKCNWGSCTLRTWLNSDYYDKTFSDEEKFLIADTKVDGVTDKVYLLSEMEATSLFKNDSDRVAKYKGISYNWWLRSTVNAYGEDFCGVNQVYDDGDICYLGVTGYGGVRPVINIDLSNL